ncbi:dTDP-4-dehydrorhamnose 3,5-epimerase [Guyparkeria sp. SCN-R1]|uniref:dTDP-4-dehydrorhamnose 3,5-epimerase n=1 Tax=Guyparkeria sp. SCN-R1 TaxID=2341113 RepID=UPI000F651513|nr:dTDP-4-dehydrorhamnose 3,5-epimerase [Guyparkeria sp. SCN-R1]RRQ23925.1 dTDP-4-dehydrorhamnose 3,5-epimerase [Guyparkeria sp. SCN-R1]
MQSTPLAIPDVMLIEPHVFEDERGFFYESYNQKAFEEAVGYPVTFVQDNHSLSVRGTLRGLHYQLAPHPQGKLVRVTAGEVFDVAVDVRKNSPTFGQWVGQTLSADNRCQIWIPPGFAHGFLATSDVAEVQYKCTDFYAPGCEASIRWDDAELGIDWPIQGQPLLSVKDAHAPSFGDVRTFND